jgi:hypothetical protein
MNKTVKHGLTIIRACLALVILLLPLAGCKGKEPPLSPRAAAFKREVQAIIAKLAPALAGPLTRNDGKAAEQAILSLYPTAGQEQDDFPFRLGAMSKDGILLATLPPLQAIGSDFINYQLVQETLDKRCINKMRLYAPNGASVYIVLAPVMVQDNLVGIMGLRLTAVQALKRWGITEQEFREMDLN